MKRFTPSRPPGRPGLGIRWRLTLWYLLILALVLITFGGVVYATQSNSIRSSLNSDLANQANDLAAAYDPSNGQFDVNVSPKLSSASTMEPGYTATAGDQTLEALKKSGQLGATSTDGGSPGSTGVSETSANKSPALLALGKGGVALLISSDGRLLTRYGPLSEADVTRLTGQVRLPGPPRASTTSFAQSLHPTNVPSKTVPYRFFTTPLLVKDVIAGTLLVGVPDQAPAQLHRLLVTLLIAAPITLAIAAAGGLWLATRAMRPVRLIAATARSISATDLSRRLNLPQRDELGELAGTFDQMLDRLEQAFQRQRQFTSDASHELRTPLTIVQLELEHARAEAALSAEVTRALGIIRSENEHMSRLVNDLLILARADAGRAVLGREALDLSDVILTSAERLGALARERHITLELCDLPELPIVGDATYLIQMVTNVIENAIRYSGGPGHMVRIEAGDRYVSGVAQAWVRVMDDGPGIASAHLPHLFERFYRVDASRQDTSLDESGPGSERGGSGLGLSIVRWVAQSHGGDVRIESEVGRGTRVEIWLPLAPASRPDSVSTNAGNALTNVTS